MKAITLLGGAGIGAGLMYILDPDRGARRRALVRDKVASAKCTTGRALGKTARDLNNRTGGILAELRGAVRQRRVDDDVLVARVASCLGHVASHPHAIGLTAENGVVTLAGPVLASEVDRLVSAVSKVRGVRGVDDRLEVHAEAGNHPSLQGGRERTGARIDILQHNWSPATRALAGATGSAMIAYGIARRDTVGVMLGALGIALTARSVTNKELKELTHAAAVGQASRAPFVSAYRKLQSFVEPAEGVRAEPARDELH
jgi:hypothetical protein